MTNTTEYLSLGEVCHELQTVPQAIREAAELLGLKWTSLNGRLHLSRAEVDQLHVHFQVEQQASKFQGGVH